MFAKALRNTKEILQKAHLLLLILLPIFFIISSLIPFLHHIFLSFILYILLIIALVKVKFVKCFYSRMEKPLFPLNVSVYNFLCYKTKSFHLSSSLTSQYTLRSPPPFFISSNICINNLTLLFRVLYK